MPPRPRRDVPVRLMDRGARDRSVLLVESAARRRDRRVELCCELRHRGRAETRQRPSPAMRLQGHRKSHRPPVRIRDHLSTRSLDPEDLARGARSRERGRRTGLPARVALRRQLAARFDQVDAAEPHDRGGRRPHRHRQARPFLLRRRAGAYVVPARPERRGDRRRGDRAGDAVQLPHRAHDLGAGDLGHPVAGRPRGGLSGADVLPRPLRRS